MRAPKKVQFEDDEYYYYVKAVPKMAVAVPEKRVKRITTQRANQNVRHSMGRAKPENSEMEQWNRSKSLRTDI